MPAGAIDPFRVSVTFIPAPTCADRTPLRLLSKGEPEPDIDEARASVILAEEDLEIDIDLGNGDAEAQFWTCDFSHEYVTINGDVSIPLTRIGVSSGRHPEPAFWCTPLTPVPLVSAKLGLHAIGIRLALQMVCHYDGLTG